MAIEFNITGETDADRFFLGEDKVIQFEIFASDGVTPLDVSVLPLEWNMRRTDSAADPAILTKGVGSGLTITGAFSATPGVNAQRVRVAFASNDTDPLVTSLLPTPYTLKANVAYRHSLKRKDAGNEGIFTFGSITFLQATER